MHECELDAKPVIESKLTWMTHRAMHKSSVKILKLPSSQILNVWHVFLQPASEGIDMSFRGRKVPCILFYTIGVILAARRNPSNIAIVIPQGYPKFLSFGSVLPAVSLTPLYSVTVVSPMHIILVAAERPLTNWRALLETVGRLQGAYDIAWFTLTRE